VVALSIELRGGDRAVRQPVECDVVEHLVLGE
jgi:hypothetical protein